MITSSCLLILLSCGQSWCTARDMSADADVMSSHAECRTSTVTTAVLAAQVLGKGILCMRLCSLLMRPLMGGVVAGPVAFSCAGDGGWTVGAISPALRSTQHAWNRMSIHLSLSDHTRADGVLVMNPRIRLPLHAIVRWGNTWFDGSGVVA